MTLLLHVHTGLHPWGPIAVCRTPGERTRIVALNCCNYFGSTQSSAQGFLAPSVNHPPSNTSLAGSFSSVVNTTPMENLDGRTWVMAQCGRFS
jgi:hypothetical protein